MYSNMYRQNAHNMSYTIINDQHKFLAWDPTTQINYGRHPRYSQLYNSAEQFYTNSKHNRFEPLVNRFKPLSARNVTQLN